MVQQTLFKSWGKKSSYPIEVTRLIHSFLPNNEELFLEQRFRFLIDSTDLRDCNSINWYNCWDVVTWNEIPAMNVRVAEDVSFLVDLVKTGLLQK